MLDQPGGWRVRIFDPRPLEGQPDQQRTSLSISIRHSRESGNPVPRPETEVPLMSSFPRRRESSAGPDHSAPITIRHSREAGNPVPPPRKPRCRSYRHSRESGNPVPAPGNRGAAHVVIPAQAGIQSRPHPLRADHHPLPVCTKSGRRASPPTHVLHTARICRRRIRSAARPASSWSAQSPWPDSGPWGRSWRSS